MKETPWSRIRGQNSVYKEFLEIVGNGKPTGKSLTVPDPATVPEKRFLEDVITITPRSRRCLKTNTENMSITPSEKACPLVSRRRPCPKERGNPLLKQWQKAMIERSNPLLNQVKNKPLNTHRLELFWTDRGSKSSLTGRRRIKKHEFQPNYDRRSIQKLSETFESQQEGLHRAQAEELQRRDQQLLHAQLLQQN